MSTTAPLTTSPTTATRRLAQIGQHMMASTTSAKKDSNGEALDATVLFESNLSSRMYKLNRPKKLNSLNDEMVTLLRPKIDAWAESDLCKVIIGTGGTRPFCAGGDVAQIAKLAQEGNIVDALTFFKDEFELDFALARLNKPYVVIMEGFTMGGGAGLAYPAPLRVATSTTEFAMPETKIGFSPDVGSNYYLAQLDGYIGAWMAVTAQSVYGRAVYELGLASHYVPQPSLAPLVTSIQQFSEPTLPRLASLISSYAAPPPTPSARSAPSSKANPDAPTNLVGPIRVLLDHAFGQDSVEKIVAVLEKAVADESTEESVRAWAKEQLEQMHQRSPTGMKVALKGYRKARELRQLKAVMNNDLAMVTAFLSPATSEMITGITHVLIKRSKDKAVWNPSSLSDPSISDAKIEEIWFDRTQPIAKNAPEITIPGGTPSGPKSADSTWGVFRAWGLPSEETIKEYVLGSAKTSDAFAITQKELEERLMSDLAAKIDVNLEDLGQFKVGVTEKVRDVVARRCEVVKDGDAAYLKWKSEKQ